MRFRCDSDAVSVCRWFVKILITLRDPIVFPLDMFYKLVSLSDTVRIYVGFVTPNTNIIDTWGMRKWYVRNLSGAIVKQGQINVQFNTFNSSVEIGSLPMKDVYTFIIENPAYATDTSATISTLDESTIEVINENARFINKPYTLGDIIVEPDTDLFWRAKFPTNWSVTRTEGNGIITGTLVEESTAGVYAYAPTAILTRNRIAPPYVNFTPFRGLSASRVPIYQIPTITREKNYVYSITPPTKVKVSWRSSIRQDTTNTYTTHDTVSEFDMSKLTPGPIASVKISAVFS